MDSQNFTFEKIMLIDDNKIDRYTASYVIKKNQFGKEITEFDMATKALSYLQDHQNDLDSVPQIILLDINMPEMDGFQFLERLAELPMEVRERFCVVMLTSSLSTTDKEKAAGNKMVKKFLNKPLNKTTLEGIKDLSLQLPLAS
jgi:CheY-like chemotaxis protein